MEAAPGANANLARLGGRDEYRRYFDLVSTVIQRLRACYQAQDQGGTYEAGIVPGFMEKLLATIGLLRVKYTYTPADTRPLWIDLTESGFPNAIELSQVQQDLARRRERLLELAVPIALKRAVLDGLLQDLTDPPEMLAQLSERAYFDLIDETKVFL